MANCKEGLYYDICSSIEGLVIRVILAGDKAEERCKLFKSAADVVEVGRCKDCTEWDEKEGECSHWYGFRENDFCSYGTPKERGAGK